MRIAAVLLATLVLSDVASAQNCKKGIRCGGSCISASKTCHIDSPTSSRTADSAMRRAIEATAPIAQKESTVAPMAPTGPRPSDDPSMRPAWLGNALGTTYYMRGCKTADTIPERLRVYFMSEDAAKALRYSRRPVGC